MRGPDHYSEMRNRAGKHVRHDNAPTIKEGDRCNAVFTGDIASVVRKLVGEAEYTDRSLDRLKGDLEHHARHIEQLAADQVYTQRIAVGLGVLLALQAPVLLTLAVMQAAQFLGWF